MCRGTRGWKGNHVVGGVVEAEAVVHVYVLRRVVAGELGVGGAGVPIKGEVYRLHGRVHDVSFVVRAGVVCVGTFRDLKGKAVCVLPMGMGVAISVGDVCAWGSRKVEKPHVVVVDGVVVGSDLIRGEDGEAWDAVGTLSEAQGDLKGDVAGDVRVGTGVSVGVTPLRGAIVVDRA